MLQPFFNSDSISVVDKTVSGRSSKSFYDEGKWTDVYNSLKAGDYVIIQFAHNDEKTDDASRYTNPQTTYKDYLNIFISGAVEKGAYPILVSSIPRNYWATSRAGDYVKQSHDAYTAAMKQVAAEKNLPFVDMELGARTFLTSKGKVYSTDSVFLNLPAAVWPNYPDGRDDNTHFQEKGAYELCKVFLNDMEKVEGFAELAHLKRNVQKAGRIGIMPKPDLKGTVTGYGVFPANTEVTITARPVSGFVFDGWSRLGSEEILSKDLRYTLTNDSTNMDVIANFGFPAGVTDIASSNMVTLFPNPVKNTLNLEVNETNWEITLSGLDGRTLLVEKNKHTLDLSHFKPGNYIISLEIKGKKYAGIVQKIP